MNSSAHHLLLLGHGNMGAALLQGWKQRALPLNVTVVDPHVTSTENPVYSSVDALPDNYIPQQVLFAVKPQVIRDVLAACAERQWAQALWISIAAGTQIQTLQSTLGDNAAVLRVMPNTPALIGRGASALCANRHVSPAQKKQGEALFAAVGQVFWLEDESLMDAFTALAGSGPAYVFALIEAMTEAGIAAGLSQEVAAQAARFTVTGAGELAHRSDKSAEELRRQVTSPGGTTEAALNVLLNSQSGLKPLMCEAIISATKRGKELAKQ